MSKDTLTHLYSSALAGSVAELITVPIDTIKTQYQTSGNSLFKTIKNNNYSSLYRSAPPAVFRQLLSTSSKFTIYHMLGKYFETTDDNFLGNVRNGLIAGAFQSILTNPTDVVRVLYQNGESVKGNFKNNGYGLFYRGLQQNFYRNITITGIQLPVLSYVSSYIAHNTDWNRNVMNFISSVMTVCIVTSVVHPLDFLKVRGMAGKNTWLGWNPVNYYRGIHLSMLRSLPHFVITVMIYKWLCS
jgi:hypothetical protein